MVKLRKEGLFYFPLETTIMGDIKIQRLLLEHGTEGFAVFIVLLCFIYDDKGYYTHYSEELICNTAFLFHIPEIKVNEIIQYCVKVKLLYLVEKGGSRVLTSPGIQRRFRLISKKKWDPQTMPFHLCDDRESTSSDLTTTIPTETTSFGETDLMNKKTNIRNENQHATTTKQTDDERRAELERLQQAALSSNRNG